MILADLVNMQLNTTTKINIQQAPRFRQYGVRSRTADGFAGTSLTIHVICVDLATQFPFTGGLCMAHTHVAAGNCLYVCPTSNTASVMHQTKWQRFAYLMTSKAVLTSTFAYTPRQCQLACAAMKRWAVVQLD